MATPTELARIHREIGIRNHLKTRKRLRFGRLRPAHDSAAAAFICGSPQIFDKPLIVNVRARELAANVAWRSSPRAK